MFVSNSSIDLLIDWFSLKQKTNFLSNKRTQANYYFSISLVCRVVPENLFLLPD